uniref:histone PARylation factor 1-like n=1 Tax=Styela clava TaxID=7725 RepID=UPI00193A14B8|nr:histone PARylation factor 1-like [Styela clava]
MPPKKRQKQAETKQKPKVSKKEQIKKSLKIDTENTELLKDAYNVTFPADLHQLWELCCQINKAKPLEALSSLGLRLVGPFEVLAKTIKPDASNSVVNFYLHWRFFYDPPELMTLIISDDTKENPYHIGYLRDDPNDKECIVVSNSGNDCEIDIIGDNIFCAINNELQLKLSSAKGKQKSALQNFSSKFKEYVDAYNIDLKAADNVNERRKHIVDYTFHKAGIVVPIDENEVGYRPVQESTGTLRRMFKNIDQAVNDDARIDAFEVMQLTMTNVQLANDECDFGMGLELGINMFCYGSRYLNKAAGRMLSMAYELLKRDLYKKIIERHLADRRKENYARLPIG